MSKPNFDEEQGGPEAPSGEELNPALPVRPDPRQSAYDAVYEYVRGLGPYLPPDPVHRNAIIWRAVHTALGATPTGRCISSHCVEGGHILPVEGEGEVPASDQQDTGRRCPRCDCPDGHEQCDHCKVCPHASASTVAGLDDFIRERCPHCDEPQPRNRLDEHVATAHADLPPCTAMIDNDTTDSVERCAFRSGHDSGEYGKWHASRADRPHGRHVWSDGAPGATASTPRAADQTESAVTGPEFAIALHEDDGTLLAGIHPDGQIQTGPNYQPDTAAREFWDAVTRAAAAANPFGGPQ